MSLLDRVQRRAAEEAAQPSPEPAPAQEPAAFPSPPLHVATEDELDGAAGWRVRRAPAASDQPARADSAPAPAQAAPAAVPLPRSRPVAPASAVDATRQTSLLNRTGGSRSGLPRAAGHGTYSTLRSTVRNRLVDELAGNPENSPPEVVRQRIAELVNEVVNEQGLTMPRLDKQRITETVIHDVLGLGPLEDLLANEEVTEIMVNGYQQIYVEMHGKITLSPVTFESNDHLMQVIDRIVSSIGRRVDESSPMVDARLKDGSRVNVIIPPLALKGPTVTIRKFAKEALEIEDLIRYGSITRDMVTFLRACVRARLNVVVSGGTGSGKTTTLNILSGFIPDDERIVTIEDAAELQLRQEHVVTLETRPANVEGRGRVAIRDLVINALRMRPDRIVVGECRGGEALDMLQAMNTGHDGSLTTLHANNARDCISRLETMVLMAGAELPSRAIREQIGSAIHVIVQQARLRDGSRKVVSVSEVLGTDDDEVRLQDLFVFRQTGIDEDGKVLGSFMPTSNVPTFLDHLRTSGEEIDATMFQPVHVAEAAS